MFAECPSFQRGLFTAPLLHGNVGERAKGRVVTFERRSSRDSRPSFKTAAGRPEGAAGDFQESRDEHWRPPLELLVHSNGRPTRLFVFGLNVESALKRCEICARFVHFFPLGRVEHAEWTTGGLWRKVAAFSTAVFPSFVPMIHWRLFVCSHSSNNSQPVSQHSLKGGKWRRSLRGCFPPMRDRSLAFMCANREQNADEFAQK